MKNLKKACFEKVVERKKKGTKQKDLFYYLASIGVSRGFPPDAKHIDFAV